MAGGPKISDADLRNMLSQNFYEFLNPSFRENRSAETFTGTILFRVDIHNPSTVNNVSAYTTELTASPLEIVPKDICLPAALRKVVRPHTITHVSVRQNLTYSPHGIRGWE